MGAFNSHSETTGTQSNPEVATEKKESEGIATYKSDTTTTGETATYGAPAGLQPTGAYNSYNAYQGYSNNYNKGAANTYTGAGTTYGNPSGQQPSGAYNQGYYSGYTGAANNGGAYNAYQGYSGHTGATNNAGAYNAYTGAGTTTYGGGQQTTELTTLTTATTEPDSRPVGATTPTMATLVPRLLAPTSRTLVLMGRLSTANRRARGSYVRRGALLSTFKAVVGNTSAVRLTAGRRSREEESLVCWMVSTRSIENGESDLGSWQQYARAFYCFLLSV